ncbi:DUF1592 domain-containing protein [Lignipirellula cremea]|uniref:Planctomycete cytochrome C n=1 Tax=Lignipirellula cremea TaxID=2528010 RepID=A0A518DLF2_9BACT|nr:DUF1592 domain-containing protein [Lignipirellula cremea]QDU92652.1 hypothetical protein Pla8534_04000 [Lignipirellula cremea]
MTHRILLTIGVALSMLASTYAAELPDFQKEVTPILQARCVRCHGPEVQEARIRLDQLSPDLIGNRPAAETWNEVRNVLHAAEMPPEGEPALTEKEFQTLTRWVTSSLEQAIAAQRQTHGRVVLRRLNRVEYQNTMQDLLGLEMDYARDLPPDGVSGDGFRNNGQSLQMSALQLEYYLETARRALERVIVSGPAPETYERTFTESNVASWLPGIERANRLGRKQEFLGTMLDEYPESGRFRLRLKFSAELKPEYGNPLLEVSIGYRVLPKFPLFKTMGLIEIDSDEPQVLEFTGYLEDYPMPVREQVKFPGLVIRVRNLYDDGSPLPKADKKRKNKQNQPYEDDGLPTINVESVEFQGRVFEQWPPQLHRRILLDSDLRETDEAAYVAKVLQPFMQRAYRRPVQPAEVEKMQQFFTAIREEFPTFEDALRETLAMVLIRPDFLYLIEPAGEEKRPLQDWELASRLSYFLWSTMPDDELRDLAAAGKLQQPSVLEEQVERMLADPRSWNFVEQFTQQWLHLDGVERVAVSKDYYPQFDETLKAEMQAETQHFFAELLRTDGSALNLLQSDFTILNERLARHYGIPGVLGNQFRRVPLPADQHRGGLLGHASVLLSNSTGEDAHAVRRAVWIRDRLLNDPPAPPPADVPSLEEADPEFHKLSIREQLKIHRGNAACASCHRDIDPWGIALENFDAVGLWRDEVRRKVDDGFETLPVLASDQMPDGQEIAGADALREYLATNRKDAFAQALVERLLTYALGRRLELGDQEMVDKLTQEMIQNDYRLGSLVRAIAASEPFLTK